MSETVQVWFEFASTYSYPAVTRVEDVARAAGVAVAWRPFLLAPIFGAQGWKDSPFNIYPVKGRYMWRDMERICAQQRIPLRRPTRFPRNGLTAARIATAAAAEPWLGDFVRAVYRANFADDREISDSTVLGSLLEDLRQPAAVWLERAQTPDVKDELRRATEEAQRLGIFGAPSFVVRDELFWGNDRLEAAVDWALDRAAVPA